jgi:hypothetical protein
MMQGVALVRLPLSREDGVDPLGLLLLLLSVLDVLDLRKKSLLSKKSLRRLEDSDDRRKK